MDALCSLGWSAFVKAVPELSLEAPLSWYPSHAALWTLLSPNEGWSRLWFRTCLPSCSVVPVLCNKRIQHLFSAVYKLMLILSIRNMYIKPTHIYTRAIVNITPLFQNELSGIPSTSQYCLWVKNALKIIFLHSHSYFVWTFRDTAYLVSCSLPFAWICSFQGADFFHTATEYWKIFLKLDFKPA